jgi:hypothetical protein
MEAAKDYYYKEVLEEKHYIRKVLRRAAQKLFQ